MEKYLAGLIQLDTQKDREGNLQTIERYIKEAAAKGVKIVVLPELANTLNRESETASGPSISRLSQWAKEYGIWIHCGSFLEYNPKGLPYNTSLLLDNKGNICGRYRKIHLFDVSLADGTWVKESDHMAAGNETALVQSPFGMLGFTICYDVRFPELFRKLAVKGAQVIFVPASFTETTGKAHWEVLLRARAIENGCYILAAGQTGEKRAYKAYGHSMAIDPWGNILAQAGQEEGLIAAPIDLSQVEKVRKQIPTLFHRKPELYREGVE